MHSLFHNVHSLLVPRLRKMLRICLEMLLQLYGAPKLGSASEAGGPVCVCPHSAGIFRECLPSSIVTIQVLRKVSLWLQHVATDATLVLEVAMRSLNINLIKILGNKRHLVAGLITRQHRGAGKNV